MYIKVKQEDIRVPLNKNILKICEVIKNHTDANIYLMCLPPNNLKDIKDYVKVNATIIESGYRYIGPSSEESKIDYIKVKYEYKNNEYIKELRVNVLLIYPKVGSNRTILINPNNPEEVDNHYIRVLCLIASVLLFIFNLFVFNAYRIRKKQVS